MNHINAAARDYVESHFPSPKTIRAVSKCKPPNNTLKCSICGTEQVFPDNVAYEELAACPDDDCLGQCFCNKWDGWESEEVPEGIMPESWSIP